MLSSQPVITALATIAPAPLSVTGTSTAANKTYDATNAATVTGGTLSGVLTADIGKVGLTQSGTFASPNAGTNIQVTATDTLGAGTSGANASANYVLSSQPVITALATITPASLTVLGKTVADNIVYDGTPDVLLSGGVLNGVLPSDIGKVTMNQQGNFISYYVGTAIPVIASNTLSGGQFENASANYRIIQQPIVQGTANISAAPLTVDGLISALNKTYDGTNAATFKGSYLSGILTQDISNILLNQLGLFASANVGSNIQVFPAMTLSGSAAGNYLIIQPNGTYRATISPISTPNADTLPILNPINNNTILDNMSGSIMQTDQIRVSKIYEYPTNLDQNKFFSNDDIRGLVTSEAEQNDISDEGF